MTGFAFIGGPLNGQIIETGGAPDWRAPIRKPVSLRMAQARADIPPFKDGRFDRVDASERPYDEFIYLCLSLHVAVSGPAPTENTQSGQHE